MPAELRLKPCLLPSRSLFVLEGRVSVREGKRMGRGSAMVMTWHDVVMSDGEVLPVASDLPRVTVTSFRDMISRR